MDPEIKKALANIRRRQREIEKKYGRSEDDGPVFDRRTAERTSLDLDDLYWDDDTNLPSV
jgi:hypothetical protein